MMESFDTAIAFVLKHEGGYTNSPFDPGGETKWGISKRAHPDLDIPNLLIDDAKRIYKADYWDRIDGDNLPALIDIVAFDTAVNLGVGFALSLLPSDDWRDYILNRIRRYAMIANKSPLFFKGWINRCMDLYDVAKNQENG